MGAHVQRLVRNRWLSWLIPRVIGIDLGSSHLKVLLAEQAFGRLRILEHRLVDLQEESLLSQEEINAHLRKIVQEMGHYPVALTVPQHLCLSHLVDLPPARDGEIQRLMEQETKNLSGLSDSSMVYHYHPLRPFGRMANPFWLTISREPEIQAQINRLATEDNGLSVAAVSSIADSLITTYLACRPATKRVVLIDLGATSTVVALSLIHI